jgi:ribosomal protein S27E
MMTRLICVERFTHIYCTKCKDIQLAERKADSVDCGVCGTVLIALGKNQNRENGVAASIE